MMALDKLSETPRLVFDRDRIIKGGAALADYLNDLIHQLEEWQYDLVRYANHFRGWTHASDFSKIDGGDTYSGSIATAGLAANAVTDMASSTTLTMRPLADDYAEEQLVFATTGALVRLSWSAKFNRGPEARNVYLEIKDGATSLDESAAIALPEGMDVYLSGRTFVVPTAETHTFSLVTHDSVPNLTGWVGDTRFDVAEFKR